MEFNKEATKELDKILLSVVKELDKIRKLNRGISFAEKIDIPEQEATLACRGMQIDVRKRPWSISLDENKYCLICGSKEYGSYFYLAKRDTFGRLKLAYDEEDKNILVIFLKQYPEIREKLVKRVEKEETNRRKVEADKKQKQAQTLAELQNIKKLCNSEATIEIQLPPTNNQHEFELKEENGQKIGMIKVSGLTLKIITSGNVKITNDVETPKVKRRCFE